MRRTGIACVLLVLATGHARGDLPDGYEVLYLEAHASAEVREAANQLALLMEKQFGESPAVARKPLWGGTAGIQIGAEPGHTAFDTNPLTNEILVERVGNRIRITGSDNPSASFAVYRFAAVFLGWRYYQPGELGLEQLDSPPAPVPSRGENEILLLETGSFFSRNPYSLGRFAEGPDWRAWHSLRERFEYNHTLHRVLPPTEFDRNPDWFAKNAEGKPMRPPYYPNVHGYNDHPDLSRKEVRDWVIEETLGAIETATPFTSASLNNRDEPVRYPRVRQSPGVLSVSISLGDSFVFGHFAEDYPWKPEGYFRRWPDWSNHVFAYSNAIAESIENGLQAGSWSTVPQPRLYIGALAYLNWENIPDFPIHPSIIPYLTFDRSQWYDTTAKEDDLGTVASWNATAAPFLGTWDYLFGYGFLIPRSMLQIVSESIPGIHKRGVRAYFNQIAAIWPYDGHTNWLMAKLLWDVDQDTDILIEEYFSEFYGPAAQPMRAFFAHAERIWMGQPGSGWWLRHWKDPWQAGLWTEEDLIVGRTHLNNALEAARSADHRGDTLPPERFHERVRMTAGLFSFTQAFHAFQSLCWNLQAPDWDAVSENQLHKGIELSRAAMHARDLMRNEAGNTTRSPYTSYAADLDWVFRYDSLGANMSSILVNLISRFQDDSATDTLEDLLVAWARTQGLDWIKGSRIHPAQVLNDQRFLNTDNPKIWHRQFMDSEGMTQDSVQTSGGFTAGDVRRGHLYQLFAANPGDFYLGEVNVRTQQSLTGEVYIRLDFFDASHNKLAESRRGRIAPVELAGPDQTIRALMQAPPGAAYGRLFIRFYEMDPGTRAYLESASVLQLKRTP